MAFYLSLFPPDNLGSRPLLSLGCGSGRLEVPLDRAGLRIIGLDRSRDLLLQASLKGGAGDLGSTGVPPVIPAPILLEADLRRLPLRGSFAGAFSGLLSFAYLTGLEDVRALLGWLFNHLEAGARLTLDVPIAYRPQQLQGVEEDFTEGHLSYRFRYLDVLAKDETGCVLDTEMAVQLGQRQGARTAPLRVYTPAGIKALLISSGFADVNFYAPYDVPSAATEPPREVLRAVVGARRR